MKNMTCQQVQNELQELLDARFEDNLPAELHHHVKHCPSCQPWLALFRTTATILPDVPDHFTQSVLNRYRREQNRTRWLRYSSYLACAAAVAIALFTWFIQHPDQMAHTREPLQPPRTFKPDQLIASVRQEINSLTERSWSLPNPSIELPSTFTSWEFTELDNPLEIGYPTLRNFSQAIQYAIEPFEEPTRHAISRVKAVIEAPEVKKWVNRFI